MARFSKKHYNAIARALNQAFHNTAKDSEGEDGVLEATSQIAQVFAADNPRFNRERFETAVRAPHEAPQDEARRMGGEARCGRKLCGYCGEPENTPEHRASNCAAKQRTVAKYETPGCTCAARSWFGEGHDSACPARCVRQNAEREADAPACLAPPLLKTPVRYMRHREL